MKNTIIAILLVTGCTITSCNNFEKKQNFINTTENPSSTSSKPLLAEATKDLRFSKNVFYVTASSGLTLRAGSNLNSKKILTLPFGAQVKLLSSPAHTEMTVEGVKGKMLEINYQGARGFAFDGYLSSLAPPQEDEDIENYANRVSTYTYPVKVLKSANVKSTNAGVTTTIELPAKTWNEMYKITQRLFNLPKGLPLQLNGKDTPVVIVNKNKRERTIKDELVVHVTENGQVERVVYFYKLRDYSREVTLSKIDNGFSAVEVEKSL